MNGKSKAPFNSILFADFYQLTMAQLYFRNGLHESLAQFDHTYRSNPSYGVHKAGCCINAGLESLLDWMSQCRFEQAEIEYLRSQTSRTGNRVFADDFLEWLAENGSFSGITMYAIPEGRVIHPNVPLTVVQGPLPMAQILETALLNHLNYQTLIATKACRIRAAGRGQLLLEFGMRRGHDAGVNAGARAALIGGADFTSNVSASRTLGYPPKGTHAHSMVQVYMAMGEGELGAFRAYADLYPDECLLLVDTIDTLGSGIPNAIKVFEELRAKGQQPLGIRLDSGDLAHLSIQAAKMLDRAGFPDTKIVLSNELDELVIWQILTQIEQEAPHYGLDADRLISRLIYGVGTRLITSMGESALDGVYKLVAVQRKGEWVPAIKVSETTAKIPNPGKKKIWRLYDQRNRSIADLLTLEDEDPRKEEEVLLHHPTEHGTYKRMARAQLAEIEPLLVEVMREGKLVYELPSIEEMRSRRETDWERLDPGVRRIMNPHIYHVSLSQRLWNLKQDLTRRANRSG